MITPTRTVCYMKDILTNARCADEIKEIKYELWPGELISNSEAAQIYRYMNEKLGGELSRCAKTGIIVREELI